MKQILIVLFLLIVLHLPHHAFAQKEKENLFKGIFSAGLNLAQIDGDGPVGYNYAGAKAGIGTLVFVYKKTLSLSLEMNYTMRGSRTAQFTLDNGLCRFKQRTDYIELPFCVNFYDKKLALFQLGLVPAALIKSSLHYEPLENSGNSTPPDCLQYPISKFDLSARAGLYFFLKQQPFAIGVNYTYSLLSIRPPCYGFTRANGQYHNVVDIGAFYVLGISDKKKHSR